MIFHNTNLRGRPESRPHLPLGRAARIGGQVTGGTPSSSSGVWVQSHDLGFSNYLLEIRNNGTLLLLFSVCHYFSRVWVGEDPQTATFFGMQTDGSHIIRWESLHLEREDSGETSMGNNINWWWYMRAFAGRKITHSFWFAGSFTSTIVHHCPP